MIPNRIINVIDNAGNRLTYESKTIRGNANYRDILTVVTPATLSTVVIANYLLYDARNENITQYLVPSSLKGKDIIDPTHENYQDWAEWNVFEVSIHQNALAKISRHNKGKIGLSFNFVVKTADTRATNFIGYFGNVDVPLSATEGDYYICELSTYVSTNAQITFNYGQYAIWVSGAWVKSASFTLIGNTTTKEISVDPSVVGIAPTVDDETANDIYVELGSIQDRVTTAEADIDEVQQDIIDMKDGTDAFSEITLGTPPNVVTIRYIHTNGNNFQVVGILYPDGREANIDEEMYVNFRNESGATRDSGIFLMTDGLSIGNQAVKGILFNPTSQHARKFLGVVTVDGVAVNAKSKATRFGIVHGIPTTRFRVTGTAYAEGQYLWATADGLLSNVAPAKPALQINVGIIINLVGGNADILVCPIVYGAFGDSSDVIITTPTNGDVAILGSDGIWRNSQRLVTAENEINSLQNRVQSLEETSDYTFDISNSNRYAKFLSYKMKALYDTSVITLVGDSTGNETTEWFYKFAQHVKNNYPKHNISYTLYGSALEEYPPLLENIQNGESGKAYADIIGISGRSVSSNDKSEYDIVGDIEVVVNVKLNSFSADKYLAGKLNGSGNFSWYFQITSTKNLRFAWSENGTSLINSLSTIPLTINAGDDVWLKATLDVDNGASGNAVNFFYSSDGITWSTLGATVTKAGVTSIFNSNAKLEFGASNNGSNPIDGYFYSGYVRNGINGGVVASPNINLCNKGDLTFYDTRGNLWTLLNGATRNGAPSIVFLNASVAGVGVEFYTNETRFNKVFAVEPDLVFINLGHNDGLLISTYQSVYASFITQILTKWSNAGVIGMTQNPQISPRTEAQIRSHAKINKQSSKALVVGNYGFIDIYTMFLKQSNITDLISSSDGVHPTELGSDFWRDQVIKYMVALWDL